MIEELRSALKEKTLTFGTERTLKSLKLGKAKAVFVASNCPKKIREQVSYYAGISGAKVVEIELPDKEIGLVCKKPFAVSVLSY